MTSPRGARAYADKPNDNRNPFQRDRDRIIYSSAYRRLAGVTQVVAAQEGHVFHNRLTHTIKVAQVARRLAEKLASDTLDEGDGRDPKPLDLDPDVAEASAHAHDIGHPPFGHVAEVELQRLLAAIKNSDSFEGNAQSFRIVTKVAKSSPDYPGLNLTRATLNGILKYPWLRHPEHPKASVKWGAYLTEEYDFRFARGLSALDPLPGPGEPQSLEAAVMDWADDITYAVHDVEDLYRAGLIPAERLRAEDGEADEFCQWVLDRWQERGKLASQEEVARALKVFPTFFGSSDAYQGTGDQRVALRLFTSSLIARYVRATNLRFDDSGSAPRWILHVPDAPRLEVDVLKELTWRYVIERPALAAQQHGQKAMVAMLFETFMDAASTKKNHVARSLLPARVNEEVLELERVGAVSDASVARVVCDGICAMTEDEVVRLAARLGGRSMGSVRDAIV